MNYKHLSMFSILFVVILWGTLVSFSISTFGTPVNASGKKVIVYYFHGEFRCQTCLKIEELTQKAVTGGFKKELAESKIEFKVLNIDLPQNAHFIKDYNLETKSVIISEYNGSKQVRWKNLPKIWDYYSNEIMFIKYIQGEIKKYL
jgi:hypothetical protein